jgi:UDP-2,4-diacetamido-2,4,6-trideoxy-beta-L-altropyranose hydrolase
MKKLIFRADGNSDTGLGHLYRIFALIEIYKADFECVLLSSENTTSGVIPKDYAFKAIPANITIDKEPQWLSEQFQPKDHWIIADGYRFTAEYQRSLKTLGYQLAYIDDLQREHQYADIIINHSLTAKSTDYNAEPYTTFALGTQYAILRPLFLEAAKKICKAEKITQAFICFGGADPLDLTLKAATALLEIDQLENIHVVVGGAYIHKEITELEKANSKLKIHRNLSEAELLGLMQECNFAIVSSSTILYELCCVKMPVLSGYYVENQKNLYKGCLDNNLIFEGGNFEHYSITDFRDKTMEILTDTHIQAKLDTQSTCFDAGIKDRFLALITEVSYRKANEGDMLLLYNWANDKVSRENSYFTEPIALETHKAWFEKKLKDTSSAIYIAEVNGVPAGMIRYDLTTENAVVGISVAEPFRGKGLAPVFLKETAKLYFKEFQLPVWAYIKQQNTASVRSFEKAGYHLLRTEMVHGAESFVYTLQP